jgi:ATP-dependent Clp protease ATP-binding subunit ClpC
MQAFDKGTITLQNGGQTINFNNAIFILTSNLGALSKPISFGLNSTMQNQAGEKNIEHAVAMALNRLRPEFVNRIEEKIVFSSLNDGQIGQALERYVARRNKDYRSKYGVEVTLSPALIKELVESCDTDFEDRRMYNARPVIQKYKRMIEGRISQSCIEGGIVPGSQIYGTLADQSSKDQKIDERIEIWRAKDKSIVKKGSVVSDKKNSLEKKDAAKPAALIDL